MPYFIATVWTMADDDDGKGPEHVRRIVRQWAETPEAFVAHIKAEDANDELVIGPVGLAKNQER